MFGLTDWVAWSSLEATDNLWLVLGHPFSSGGDPTAVEWRYEWVRYAEAVNNSPVDAWLSCHADVSGANRAIRHFYSYDGLTFLPQDRTSTALTPGAGDGGDINEPYALHDGSNYRLYYESNYGSQLNVATAASVNGPWTPDAGNPIITLAAGESQLSHPFVVLDLSEPDANNAQELRGVTV